METEEREMNLDEIYLHLRQKYHEALEEIKYRQGVDAVFSLKLADMWRDAMESFILIHNPRSALPFRKFGPINGDKK